MVMVLRIGRRRGQEWEQGQGQYLHIVADWQFVSLGPLHQQRVGQGARVGEICALLVVA
jgi:hypothetical protein